MAESSEGKPVNKGLDKLTLNNFIVKNRPSIRKAKVHVVNRILKRGKELRNKKTANEKEREKNSRRADSLLKEVAVIRKFHEDDLMKFALLNKKTLDEAIADVNVTVEERGLWRVATWKTITPLITKFRQQYPDWEKKLPQFLKTLGLKYREAKLKALKSEEAKKKFLEKEHNHMSIIQKLTNVEKDGRLLIKAGELMKSENNASGKNSGNNDRNRNYSDGSEKSINDSVNSPKKEVRTKETKSKSDSVASSPKKKNKAYRFHEERKDVENASDEDDAEDEQAGNFDDEGSDSSQDSSEDEEGDDSESGEFDEKNASKDEGDSRMNFEKSNDLAKGKTKKCFHVKKVEGDNTKSLNNSANRIDNADTTSDGDDSDDEDASHDEDASNDEDGNDDEDASNDEDDSDDEEESYKDDEGNVDFDSEGSVVDENYVAEEITSIWDDFAAEKKKSKSKLKPKDESKLFSDNIVKDKGTVSIRKLDLTKDDCLGDLLQKETDDPSSDSEEDFFVKDPVDEKADDASANDDCDDDVEDKGRERYLERAFKKVWGQGMEDTIRHSVNKNRKGFRPKRGGSSGGGFFESSSSYDNGEQDTWDNHERGNDWSRNSNHMHMGNENQDDMAPHFGKRKFAGEDNSSWKRNNFRGRNDPARYSGRGRFNNSNQFSGGREGVELNRPQWKRSRFEKWDSNNANLMPLPDRNIFDDDTSGSGGFGESVHGNEFSGGGGRTEELNKPGWKRGRFEKTDSYNPNLMELPERKTPSSAGESLLRPSWLTSGKSRQTESSPNAYKMRNSKKFSHSMKKNF